MTTPSISITTKKKVFELWQGRCGFCGIKIAPEEHHILLKSRNPLLVDDVNNLILVCSLHHSLAHKKKENGKPIISLEEINDLIQSKHKDSNKRTCSLQVPDENVPFFLGLNKFSNFKYLLVINNKPLIEVSFQKTVKYATYSTLLIFMKFFDKDNNFIGGMYGDHWASVVNQDWSLSMTTKGMFAKNNNEDVWINVEIYDSLVMVKGHLFYDGIEVEIGQDKLCLNKRINIKNIHFTNSECILMLEGNKEELTYSFNGKLN